MMLETLQSKLSCIQKTVKAMPRTGYAPQSRGVRTPQPDDVCHKAPSFDDLELLDEEFMALVDCPIPSSSTPPPNRKRKAEEVLAAAVPEFDFSSAKSAYEMPPEVKKMDLKTRNRWSAKASRIRKKAHLDNLHAQVEQLTNHNLELANVCEELAQDNEQLRKELLEHGGQLPTTAEAPQCPGNSPSLSESSGLKSSHVRACMNIA